MADEKKTPVSDKSTNPEFTPYDGPTVTSKTVLRNFMFTIFPPPQKHFTPDAKQMIAILNADRPAEDKFTYDPQHTTPVYIYGNPASPYPTGIDLEGEDYVIEFDDEDMTQLVRMSEELYKVNAVIFAAKFCIQPNDRIKYYVYQREICPHTRKIHIQGYIEFNKTTTFNQVLEVLPKTMRDIGHNTDTPFHPCIFVRRGTQQQAIEYCKKQESRMTPESFLRECRIYNDKLTDFEPIEFGAPARQGASESKKTGLDEALDTITADTTVRDFALANRAIYVRYHQGIEKLINHAREDRKTKTQTTVIFGDSGAGKTYGVFQFAREQKMKVYKLPHIPADGKIWWDGYDTQEIVLIDEYEPKSTSLVYLQQLCDAYQHKVPYKGGFANFAPKYIFITSNHHPYEWFSGLNVTTFKAFSRRLEKVIAYGGSYSGRDTDVKRKEIELTYENYVAHVPKPSHQTFLEGPIFNEEQPADLERIIFGKDTIDEIEVSSDPGPPGVHARADNTNDAWKEFDELQ